jgi:predicted Zn-dependent protease
MINKEQNPVGWTMLMYELDDAKEHLNNLIAEIQNDPKYNEANLRVDLGHVYSHLNRAWHRRNNSEDVSEAEWVEASKFPNDLEPI